MLVLGIDPGTALIGFGLVAKAGARLTAVEHGVIRTPAGLGTALRLVQVHEQVKELLERYQPDAVAVEEIFFHRNAKTFSAVSQARGALILTVAQYGIQVFEYTPLQVKQAVVGYGRAEKEQVQKMVKAILKMDEIARPDDAADALAIAICHIHSYRGGDTP
ncbi:MAG: crossover junction endodeoxyribonuclease RuvC [Syntrophomonadaceae bacterium]|jgi:crossover junction endodeoxyribonuclease RuvC|nr:crossover junction endodeoxyribonuclease RuvC [Syntrophomonadaceae bacterium]